MARHKEDRFDSAQAFRKALAKSVPGAMALDDSDLQQLVSTVMAADLAEAIEMLPESVSGVALKPAGESGDEALLTLTVSAAGLSEPTEPTARHVSEATFQPARPVLPPPVPPPAEPARRGPLFVVVGVLAFVFVVLATVAGVAVLRSTRPEITAVPLPSGVRASAEDPASGEVDPDPVVDEPPQGDSPESDAPSADPAADETAAEAETDTPELPEEPAPPVRQAGPPSTERSRRVRPGRRRVPPTRTTPPRSDPGGVFLTDDF